MKIKTKIGLAVFVVAFLLLCPMGVCSGVVANASTHSCHQKTPAPMHDCSRPGCIYLKAAASEMDQGLAGLDQGQPLAVPAIRAQASESIDSRTDRVSPDTHTAPRERLLLVQQSPI